MTEANIDQIAPVVHGEPTPEPESEPITFDERQQKFLDEVLIPRAMGRSAKDIRAELAATKSRLANAEAALKAQSPDSSETERLKAELQLSRAESEAVKSAAAEAVRIADIERELSKANVIDVSLLRTAIADRVQRQGNGYVILDDAGVPREGVTLKQFIEEETGRRPYLIRGTTITGSDQRGSYGTASSLPPRVKVEEVFGPRSSSRAASDLMRRSPQEYRRLKQEAISKGIL